MTQHSRDVDAKFKLLSIHLNAIHLSRIAIDIRSNSNRPRSINTVSYPAIILLSQFDRQSEVSRFNLLHITSILMPIPCHSGKVMHGEDFVGGEVEVAGDVALGEDVDGLGAPGRGPDGAGEVVFGRKFVEWGKLTERAIGEARSGWFGGAEVGLAAVAFRSVALAAEDL